MPSNCFREYKKPPKLTPPDFWVREIERTPLSTCLTRLDLFLKADHYHKDGDGVAVFVAAAAALPRCAALRELRLFLAGLDKDCYHLPRNVLAALPLCPSLQTLVIAAFDRGPQPSWYSVGEPDHPRLKLWSSASELVAEALAAMTGLTSLEFRGVALEQGDKIHAALSNLPSLRRLQLRDVDVSNGWMPFAELPQLTAFEALKVESIGKDAVPLLQDGALETLVVANCPMEPADQLRLVEIISAMPRLTHLGFGQTEWSQEAIDELCSALPKLATLRSLNVRSVGDSDRYDSVFQTLFLCTALTELELSHHENVSEDWAEVAGSGLAACRSLKSLALRYVDGFDNESIVPLLEELPNCAALEAVELFRCRMGTPALCLLLLRAPDCASLRSVKLIDQASSVTECEVLHALAKQANLSFFLS